MKIRKIISKEIPLRRSEMTRIRLCREQILILAASAFFAAAYLLSGRGEILREGSFLPRSGYGEKDGIYSLEVEGLPEGRQRIDVRVRAREYTQQEAEAAFEGIAADAASEILGGNPSLREISKDLYLPAAFASYPGIHLSWDPEDSTLISPSGEVHNDKLEAPAATSLHLLMKTGTYRDEIILPVTVLPPGEKGSAGMLPALEALIEETDQAQRYSQALELPASLDGVGIRYRADPDLTWIRILLGGVTGAVLIGMKPAQDRKKAAKIRESELLLDYAEFVSRLMVYLGAGLTVRNAWVKITGEYREAREAGRVGEKAVYEEMLVTALELEKGVPERRTYVDFAHRCGLRCYLRLASILEQNLRAGDRRLGNALELEVQEALEQRRNTARRLGEEAGTKLILPLIMSLAAVMMIVTVPAMLTLAH
ncbi:MAG: hypothetical protein IKE56_01350 [Lachnospiraceae bacterium]|nr:hypothetical protein [Lachnospiraceae bacterium]